VYVDNDPLVMVHARALLAGASDVGVTDYVEADVRTPDKILQEAARTLDFSRTPVGQASGKDAANHRRPCRAGLPPAR
jgi:hypothetical protein